MSSSNSRKILVCDDDDSILEVVKIILEENGYQVKTLNSGKGILEKLKEYSPDVMLMDLWMPGIDGKEITKMLKKDPQTKNIPIIVVSALNQTEKIAREIGADDFLPKPFDIKDLIACVEKNLK